MSAAEEVETELKKQNQQLLDLVTDLQDKDSMNKQLIQKILETTDGSAGSSQE
jgi:hypothetical protein